MNKEISKRNIILSYFITAFRYPWFWSGVWIVYYASFGGFRAVGILETVMVVTTLVAEIPTGAIADLLGKKGTIAIGLLLLSLANIWMASAPNLMHMVFALILMNIGGALLSGSFEALIYDSLKQDGKENEYDKVLGNTSAITFLMIAICSIIGGYIAQYNMRLTFFLCGVGILIACGLSSFLIEPKIDTEKFSIGNYFKQTAQGAKHLFRSFKISAFVIPLLLASSVLFLMYEGFDNIMVAQYGFFENEVALGIIGAISAILSSLASYFLPKHLGKKKWVYIPSVILYGLGLLLSPFFVLYAGVSTVFLRDILSPFLNIQISSKLNQVIDSKYRATALSTFSMLKSLPYAISIFFIGSLVDKYPSKYFAFILGIFMITILLLTLKNKAHE